MTNDFFYIYIFFPAFFWNWFYCLQTLRSSMSPVCGIFNLALWASSWTSWCWWVHYKVKLLVKPFVTNGHFWPNLVGLYIFSSWESESRHMECGIWVKLSKIGKKLDKTVIILWTQCVMSQFRLYVFPHAWFCGVYIGRAWEVSGCQCRILIYTDLDRLPTTEIK